MKILFILTVLMVSFQLYAQDIRIYIRDSARISNSKDDIIELTATSDSTVNAVHLPYSSFIVKDARYDTAYIGIKVKNAIFSKDITYEKTRLLNGTSASLRGYLNNNPSFTFSSQGPLLTCYIKELRVTQLDSMNKETSNRELYNRLNLQAEAYLEKAGRYYPALRLDTMIVLFSIRKNKLPVIEDALNLLAVKSAAVDTGKVFKRSSYTTGELDTRYNQRFDKPILRAQQLNAGVYATFDEFLNNNPSIKQFEFKKDKVSTILYTKTASTEWLPERKAFGFCDGRVIWMNVNNIFRPLVRQGNTFEFLADYYILHNRRGPVTVQGGSPLMILGSSLLANAANDAIDVNPRSRIVYQLKMEKGGYY